MTPKCDYSEAARMYMQIRLSSGCYLERRLSQKLTVEDGTAFSFALSQQAENVFECFEDDILDLDAAATEEIDKREAEFIYQFLKSDRRAVLIAAELRVQNLPEFPGLEFSNLHQRGSDEKDMQYGVLALKDGNVDAVRAFLPFLPSRPLLWLLTYLPDTATNYLETQTIDKSSADGIVTNCQHVIVSAFDHRGKLFWSFSAQQPNYLKLPDASAYNSLETPAPADLDASYFYYFHQRLCSTVWRAWVASDNRAMYEKARFWCIAPIEPDAYFRSNMGAAFRTAYPKVTNLRVQMARRSAFTALAAYLKTHSNAFMLTGGQFICWPESNPILPGRSADNSFRTVVATEKTHRYNRENWFMSYVFKAIIGGSDTVQCIEQAWNLSSGPFCCVIIEPRRDASSYILAYRTLTRKELEEELRPNTTHVVVGAVRNELPIVWSKV